MGRCRWVMVGWQIDGSVQVGNGGLVDGSV